MLIIGARGFAKEVLDTLDQRQASGNIAFYDDINKDAGDRLYKHFRIIKSFDDVADYFTQNGNEFTLGIGNSKLRNTIYKKFETIGGKFTSTVHPSALIGNHEVSIGSGCNILGGSIISSSVTLGKGCIVYYNAIITHDCIIGDFVEISPAVNILGRVRVGNFSHLGSNSTILPDINIGKNAIIGAGAVVTKDVPDNSMVVGIPAKIIKTLDI